MNVFLSSAGRLSTNPFHTQFLWKYILIWEETHYVLIILTSFLGHEAPNGEGLQICFQTTNKSTINISDNDIEFKSLLMSCQIWNKELNTKMLKEKTKCTINTREQLLTPMPRNGHIGLGIERNSDLESKITGLKHLEGNRGITCCVPPES